MHVPIDGRGVQVVADLALVFCPFVRPWAGIIVGVILSIKTLVCDLRLSEDLMDLCIILNSYLFLCGLCISVQFVGSSFMGAGR